MFLSIRDALSKGGRYLREKSVESPYFDAELLLCRVTGLSRAGLYQKSEEMLLPGETEIFMDMIERRGRREPVAYLTGQVNFMGLDFTIRPPVLIPRPETEFLVERAIEFLKKYSEAVVIDVGAGSGAIAVALAVRLRQVNVLAIDISPAALEVARENAQRHGVDTRIKFLEGDLLKPVIKLGDFQADLIAANLPYVPRAEIPFLMPEVSLYEPVLALDGGVDGLELYRRLVKQAPYVLRPEGGVLMEIDPRQTDRIRSILNTGGWSCEITSDLGGNERIVLANRK